MRCFLRIPRPARTAKDARPTRRRPLPAALLLAACLVTHAAAQDGDLLFNGRNLDGWRTKPHLTKRDRSSHWTVGRAGLDPEDPRTLRVESDGAQLINARGFGLDLYSEAKHGDVVIELEVMVPRGSNSGIYVMGEYEIQVLDSHGRKDPGAGDMGAIYGRAAPENPVYRKPGEWSKLLVAFRAPRFDASGKKTAPARFERVDLNGRTIHRDVTVPGPTPGGLSGREGPRGPLLLEGDHGPVAFRNIRVRPLR